MGYMRGRHSDPSWTTAIDRALGTARSVINVGAGTGSYEPAHRTGIAVEPSRVMLDQRPVDAWPAIQAVAEYLPLADNASDAALAVLSVHHWEDWRAGLRELCRVAPLRIVLTFEPDRHCDQWVIRDYLPEIGRLAMSQSSYEVMVETLHAEVIVLPLTRLFTDGVLGAYWCRPEAYLDPEIRSHMSGFALLDPSVVERAMAQLADDLETGTWARRYAQLKDAPTFDAGFRLLVSRS